VRYHEGVNVPATAYVILGALHERSRSGYDIRRFANEATGPFWAIAESQLYPELRRLVEQGLIEGDRRPTGARQRTVYRLTSRGEEALRDWVVQPVTPSLETRDEMLLRLLFSDVVDLSAQVDLVRRIALRHRAEAENLRRSAAEGADENAMHREVLGLGIDLHGWLAGWFERLQEHLESGGPDRRPREAPPAAGRRRGAST
jgi:DNA-binding PadR family transcriptional regulator